MEMLAIMLLNHGCLRLEVCFRRHEIAKKYDPWKILNNFLKNGFFEIG